MKNAENADKANYLQRDNLVKKISDAKGGVGLPRQKAWEELSWTRPFFCKKPKEGYFIWVKEQIDFSLSTCAILASKNARQDMNNLLVVEKGIKVKAFVTCFAEKMNLCGVHKAKGKTVLKEGAILEYNHTHKWEAEIR
jgi:Fe-S cluster assembly scaffold protein SufB